MRYAQMRALCCILVYVADFSKLDRPILPAPGSCRFVRLYDTHDQSEVTVEASVAGGKTVKVPVSWLAATGFAFTNGVATVDYDRNEAEVEKEYVHLQHAATLSEKFADVDDAKVTQADTSVSVKADVSAESGFYRPFVR